MTEIDLRRRTPEEVAMHLVSQYALLAVRVDGLEKSVKVLEHRGESPAPTDSKKDETAIITLSAYLVREACGLDDAEPVILNAGAEAVRAMALDAVREWDRLRAVIRDTAKGNA